MLRLGILLHVNWLAVVFAAGQGMFALATLLSAATAFLALRMHRSCSIRIGAIAAVLGTACDVLIVALDGLEFVPDAIGLPLPLWMTGLWLAFGTTLPAYAPILLKRLWLIPLLGVIGGVGAYTSARSFGAVQVGDAGQVMMSVMVGLVWATMLPFLVFLSRRVLHS